MLVMIMVTSVVVLRLLGLTQQTIESKGLFYGLSDLRPVAYSTLETGLAAIREYQLVDDNTLTSPSQGWGNIKPQDLIELPERTKVSFTVTDESAKLAIKEENYELIRQLLNELDVSFSDADEFSASLMDWIDEDDNRRVNGAEADYYERENSPIMPPNGSVASFESLLYIQGADEIFRDDNGQLNEVWHRFKRNVSLHNNGGINLLTASPELVEALAEIYGFNATEVLRQLEGPDGERGTSDDPTSLPAGIPGGDNRFGNTVSLLRIEIKVSAGPTTFTLEALVQPQGNNSRENNNTSRNQQPAANQQESPSFPFNIIELVENGKLD